MWAATLLLMIAFVITFINSDNASIRKQSMNPQCTHYYCISWTIAIRTLLLVGYHCHAIDNLYGYLTLGHIKDSDIKCADMKMKSQWPLLKLLLCWNEKQALLLHVTLFDNYKCAFIVILWCTSSVAIKPTPTDVLRMILSVVRENETAGIPGNIKWNECM